MKKRCLRLISVIALSALALFSFTACSGGEAEATDTGATSETTAVTEPDPSQPIDVKVGFIYNDYLENSTLGVLFETARAEMEKTLGVDSCYMEGVLVQDFEQAVDLLKEEGCNVIVSCSQAFANYALKVAESDLSTYFLSYGSTKKSMNLCVLEPELFQPANVMGLIAAYNSDVNRLGVVTDVSMFNCYGVTNAFVLGAKEITAEETDVRLNWASSSSESETKKAIDNLVSQGCDVIFLYQQSNFGIKYCNSLGVKVIGFAYNMPELAPDTYLSGYYYNLNNYIIDRIRLVQYQNFGGDLVTDGIRAGICRMIELSDHCKSGTKEITDTLYEYVKSGKAPIFRGEVKDNYENIRIDKGATLSHDQIMSINWLEKSVTNIESYTTAKGEDDIVPSDFTIRE